MNIITFWFDSKNCKKWFSTDSIFDNQVYQKYNTVLIEKRQHISKLTDSELFKQFNKTELLELIILFDQISRNIYRVTNHSDRNTDDEISLKLSLHYINVFEIVMLQEHFYFIILPLRHTKIDIYCVKAISLIFKYEEQNEIIDNQTWMNFKSASYRSYYNATSHNIIDKKEQMFGSIEKFRTSIKYFADIIDEQILDIDNFQNTPVDESGIIYKTIFESLKKKALPKAVCVSLSGGVDSMVIAHVLARIGKKYNINVHAVHIQHSNRQEAKSEAKMIREFCHQLNIIYHQININHIKRHSDNINRAYYETETRRIRFDFYNNIKKCYKIELFALGHHRGDIAENVLTNLLKGRTLLDLPVMHEFDIQEGVTLWRPLLDIPKSEIFKYSFENGIIYTKNSTPEWSVRGKMRNIVLKTLDEMFNSVEENLYKAGEESREMFEYINKTVVQKVFSSVVYGKLGFYFPVSDLIEANLTIWKLSLQKIFHNIGLSMLKDSVIKEIMKLESKIINPCKNYIMYFDGINMIFLNTKYFNLPSEGYDIKIELESELEQDYEFNLNDLINGCVKYTTNLNIKPKQMKKKFNKILPSEILNKYIWAFPEKSKYIVSITYL